MEVLFTLFAQRYERRSVVITSNLVFSQWDRIFKDPMTTAAAIDQLVHHATTLEMTGPRRRNEEAKKRSSKATGRRPATARSEAERAPTTTTPDGEKESSSMGRGVSRQAAVPSAISRAGSD